MIEASFPGVTFAPGDIVRRQGAAWRGVRVEVVQAVYQAPFEYEFEAPQHLLVATERAERSDGETFVGPLRSTRRNSSRTLTFAPANCRFYGWQTPRLLARNTYLYIDPNGPLVSPELRFGEADFEPRLFFENAGLWDTARKLSALAESSDPADTPYAEALSIVLAHELMRLRRGGSAKREAARGGLAAWQRRAVAEYIEVHLTESISLIDLAQIVRLSPFHFSRAFKESFGVPPHRYHMQRRIELAKALLGKPAVSVTEVGARLGFCDSSAFTAAFRRLTGNTPTEYRRKLA